MDHLESLADTQAGWSGTATALRARLTVSRVGALILSTIAAISTSLASQEVGIVRHILAFVGAFALGFAGVVAKAFLSPAKISAWLRARAAAEALKREAWTYAAGAAPYDDSSTRAARLSDERERIERDVDDLLSTLIKAKRSGTAPRKEVSRTTYLERRVRQQVEQYYMPQARVHRKAASRLRWFEIFLSFLAALFTGVIGIEGKRLLSFIHIDFLAFTAVLTTIAGAVTTHLEASRHEFISTIYLATARRLNNELRSISDVTSISAAGWSDFVFRCESIIREENSSWLAKWSR